MSQNRGTWTNATNTYNEKKKKKGSKSDNCDCSYNKHTTSF